MVNVVIKEKHGDDIVFPCLLISYKGSVVLALKRSAKGGEFCGTCVVPSAKSNDHNISNDYLGEFSDQWRIDSFKPFTGTIELSNK